jgi:hypothetical protein
VLTLLPEAIWNSVVSVATEDRWFLHATRFRSVYSYSTLSIYRGIILSVWQVQK